MSLPWTQQTWKAITITQMISAFVSLAASLMISFMITRGTNGIGSSNQDSSRGENGGLKTPYPRIIFCLSICDIIQSTSFLFGPWMVPRTIPNSWGVGNALTCQINGAGVTFGSTGMLLYFCLLCVYYLYRLKYKMHDRTFLQRVELKGHLIILFISVVSTVAGCLLNTFHTSLNRSHCHFSATPLYCRILPEEFGECDYSSERVVNAMTFYNVFVLDIIAFCAIAGIMTMLYRHANMLKRMNIAFTPTTNDFRRRVLGNEEQSNHYDRDNERSDFGSSSRAQLDESKEDDDIDTLGIHEGKRGHRKHKRKSKTKSVQGTQESSALSALYRRETIIQATCYVGVYCLAYVPMLFSITMLYLTSSVVSAFAVAVAMSFYPSTGLFICLVYTRPKVALIRRSFPRCPRLLALWLVLKAGGEVPDLDNSNLSAYCNDDVRSNDDSAAQKENLTKDKNEMDEMSDDGIVGIMFNSALAIDGASQSFDEDNSLFNMKTNWAHVQGDRALDAVFDVGDTNGSNKGPKISSFSYLSDDAI